jgi:hypothetical protein
MDRSNRQSENRQVICNIITNKFPAPLGAWFYRQTLHTLIEKTIFNANSGITTLIRHRKYSPKTHTVNIHRINCTVLKPLTTMRVSITIFNFVVIASFKFIKILTGKNKTHNYKTFLNTKKRICFHLINSVPHSLLTYLLHGAESLLRSWPVFAANQEIPRILWNPKFLCLHYPEKYITIFRLNN